MLFFVVWQYTLTVDQMRQEHPFTCDPSLFNMVYCLILIFTQKYASFKSLQLDCRSSRHFRYKSIHYLIKDKELFATNKRPNDVRSNIQIPYFIKTVFNAVNKTRIGVKNLYIPQLKLLRPCHSLEVKCLSKLFMSMN